MILHKLYNIVILCVRIKENRKSVEQFFAEYGKAYEEVFNEDDDEEKEEKERGKEEGEVEDENEAEDKHVDTIMQPETALKVSDIKKTLLDDIKEILDVCNKERSQVADIARVVVESEENKEAENLNTMFLVQSVIREKNIAPGEWLFNKIGEIQKYVNGTKYDIVPAMLRGIFSKTACYLTPQDLVKEMGVEALSGKSEEVQCAGNADRVTAAENLAKKRLSEMKDFSKSGNGFPEVGLFVKSTVFPDGKRLYMCPLDGCTEGFVSPCMCDAHINHHLGYEYGPCTKCGHTNPSCDSYDKHKCFAGVKTGDKRPPSRGETAKKRMQEKVVEKKTKAE